MAVDVRFEDVDGDGDREVVVENSWLRMVLRFPEKIGEEFYMRRWTWGGWLQSLIYKPTAREHFETHISPQVYIPGDNNPFGLPDELFASFPVEVEGKTGYLKMGVGTFTEEGDETTLEPLPWTWYEEDLGAEKAVVFRQEAEGIGEYSFAYEKRYRFRDDAAWFAMDVIWENRGKTTLVSDWDIHSFHRAGFPPHTSWLVAPKRAWVSYGKTRLRTVFKEASPIFSPVKKPEMVADVIEWDLDGTPWWYALGPGDGEEFYLLHGRFEPYKGLFWAGYGAFTPQGINHIEVPPGDRAVWGFDVTLGVGGKNFVESGEDCGLTIDSDPGARTAVVGVHVASERSGSLVVHVLDQEGCIQVGETEEEKAYTTTDRLAPEHPLRLQVALPEEGDYALLEVCYREGDRTVLLGRETVALQPQRPTAHLPFTGNGARVFVASQHDLDKPEVDGRFLYSHATETGFQVDWSEPGVRVPGSLEEYRVVCLVGDAWPLERAGELSAWVEEGGGLLVCAPFGKLAAALEKVMPLQPEGDACLEQIVPPLGLRAGTFHRTAERLMLEPDAQVRVSYWLPTVATADASVTLRFTDPEQHPAVAVKEAGKGRVAAVASRPAWGDETRAAVWDAWGQFHRSCFAGLMGWAAGIWEDG